MSAVRLVPARFLALELACDLAAVRDACRQARQFLADQGVAAIDLDGWELALAEAANNAVKYVTEAGRALPVRVELDVRTHQAEVRVTDHTAGFDMPARAELAELTDESGRGIFLIQQLTDEAVYLRGAGENCMVLRRGRDPAAAALPIAGDAAGAARELAEASATLDLMTEELSSAYESLSAIFRFSTELQTGAGSDDFIRRWLNHLLTITEADWFVLRLVEQGGQSLRVEAASAATWAGAPLRVPAPGAGGPAETRAALDRADLWFDAKSPLGADDPLSVFGAGSGGFSHPLVVSEQLVGVFTIGRQDGGRPFRAGQVSVIHTIADFLALQIRSRQIHAEQVRAKLDLRDLEIAAGIQQGLLPVRMPVVPCAGLAGFYRSAREIGGDYYDALGAEGESVLLVIADVMGKGISAALFALMFRSLVHARPDLASRPGEFLEWLNRNLYEDLDRAGMFITAQLACLNSRTGQFQVASAGHPPMLFANLRGEVAEIGASGPPIGIVADASFPEDRRPWRGGQALMFTDGLMDARNPAGSLLGLDPLKAAVAASALRGDSPTDARERMVRLLHDFEAGTQPADDTAFIVIYSRKP